MPAVNPSRWALALVLGWSFGFNMTAEVVVLHYSHINSGQSVAGIQAVYFARKVAEYSNGAVQIELHPDSLLGGATEQVNLVSRGTIAIHHNIAAAFGAVAENVPVLDTPYLYRNRDHLLKVVAPGSPIMERLEQELERKGLHLLYTFYVGTRDLICDRPVVHPEDLKGVRIRVPPFPLYQTTVEGLGGIPVPIDWAETPGALAAQAVAGMEASINTILTSRFYEFKKYLMLTNHIQGADFVVINRKIWERLSRTNRAFLERAAAEASEYGTRLMVEQERKDLDILAARGMRIITEKEGLDLGAFKQRVTALLRERFAEKWSEYYQIIEGIK